MNGLGFLLSATLALLAVLILASACIAMEGALRKAESHRSASFMALRLAREIDQFYFLACTGGAHCAKIVGVPNGWNVTFQEGSVRVVRDGSIAVNRRVAAPLDSATVSPAGDGIRIAWG